ncbi:MAG: hypothetical protein J0M00_20150 [Burkholderiales bacterium]|nr:hypothetical protein [Burkholderiales bacterium]
MSQYRLKIGRTLEVPVEVDLQDGAQTVRAKLTLVVKRLESEAFAELLDKLQDGKVDDRTLLIELLLDWRQDLVLDANDMPAPLSPEALDAACTVIGLRGLMARAVVEGLSRSFEPVRQAEDKRGN